MAVATTTSVVSDLGWQEVADTSTDGTYYSISATEHAQFALDTDTPADSILGEGLPPGEPFRCQIDDGDKVYIRCSKVPCTVNVMVK